MMARSFGKMPTTSVRRLISLFKRSIAWSQNPIPPGGATERDDVADLHVGHVDHHAVDEQFYQGPPQLEGGVLEPVGEAGTEVLDASREGLQLLVLDGIGQ